MTVTPPGGGLRYTNQKNQNNPSLPGLVLPFHRTSALLSSALMRPHALGKPPYNHDRPSRGAVSCAAALRVQCPTRAGIALPRSRGWEGAHCVRLANAGPLATRGRHHLTPRGLQARRQPGDGRRRLARRRHDLRRNLQRDLRRSLRRALDLAPAREASRAGTVGCHHHRRASQPP